MKVLRNCLLCMIAIIAALAGVNPATAATTSMAATPVATITEFPVPGSPPLFWITHARDGKFWFVVNCCGERDGKIGRMTPPGQVTLFPVTPGTSPAPGITTGPDGNLWFTATNLPCDKFLPSSLASNVKLPCAERFLGLIGRMDTTGRINGVFVTPTVFPTPAASSPAQTATCGSPSTRTR